MKTERFSPMALALLALVYETPMHPYRMQQLIKERGKDEVINVQQRASIYQTIGRLLRAQLIAVRGTSREEKRPERTEYEITQHGRDTLLHWMREMLATVDSEYPAFPALLAHITLLTPHEAREHLALRAEHLGAEIERLDDELIQGLAVVPRLFLLELEYLRATISTELAWVNAVVADLESGELTWDDAWLRAVAERFEGSKPAEQR